MSKELEEKLKAAQRELDDAIVVVARCAQDVSDDAYINIEGLYSVEVEPLTELRNALAHWTACTEKFLRLVDEVGKFNYALKDSEVRIYQAQAREDARASEEGRSPRLITRVEDINDEPAVRS